MGERDTELDVGIPSNGVPSDETVRQERERWDEGKTVKELIYESALTLREPTPVSVVADRTECTPESARRHLLWFAEIGIVEPVGEGQPTQFQRNRAYFRWKRANEARRTHSGDELATRLETLLERDRAYQDEYDVSDPAQVSAFDIAAPSDHDAVEAIWTDVDDWLTVREDQRVLEHAQRLQREQQSAPA